MQGMLEQLSVTIQVLQKQQQAAQPGTWTPRIGFKLSDIAPDPTEATCRNLTLGRNRDPGDTAARASFVPVCNPARRNRQAITFAA